jgi:nucleotide-binding universal stress UspA family protein
MTVASAPARVWVAAHDASVSAAAAARMAVTDLRAAGGGTLVLCNVVSVMAPGLVPGGSIVEMERELNVAATQSLERAAIELRQFAQAERAVHGGGDVEIEAVVRHDAVAEGIVAIAVDRGAQRIVLGTHGRTGLSHLVLGSVAERVARLSPVPVLIVKEDKPG